ncbi:MAG: hypothetical protein IKU60_03610 [Clostridia bacterium]|nr:hypothetical protein [Clostridia bacterium]
MLLSGLLVLSFTQGGDEAVLILNGGIKKSFDLVITLVPIMCFWSGIMEVADKCGITKTVSRILSPLTNRLFGKEYKNTEAMHRISMNMSANLLGMGNAATPLGLEAMRALDDINPTPRKASRAMCMFIVINTASIQLVPSSVIAFRSQMGSQSPSDIMIPTVLTTICAFLAGTISAKICERFSV